MKLVVDVEIKCVLGVVIFGVSGDEMIYGVFDLMSVD